VAQIYGQLRAVTFLRYNLAALLSRHLDGTFFDGVALDNYDEGRVHKKGISVKIRQIIHDAVFQLTGRAAVRKVFRLKQKSLLHRYISFNEIKLKSSNGNEIKVSLREHNDLIQEVVLAILSNIGRSETDGERFGVAMNYRVLVMAFLLLTKNAPRDTGITDVATKWAIWQMAVSAYAKYHKGHHFLPESVIVSYVSFATGIGGRLWTIYNEMKALLEQDISFLEAMIE